MKSFKKILSTVLSALLLIGLFQVDIFKVTAITTTGAYNNLIYNLYDYETITIKDCVSNVEDIVIPNKINGHLVTTIGYQAFKDCTHLKSIVIPDSVTSIEVQAFDGCTSLENVTMSKNITLISVGTFYNCCALNSVNIANGVTSIGSSAFCNCSSLTSITIPNSVTSIGNGAFSGCTGLASITIPDGITSIGHRTFFDCSSLTNITIPDSVTSIYDYAFSGCTGLTSITIPDGVTSIGANSLSGCSSLAEVTLPFVGDKRYSIEDEETHPFGYIFGEANYSGSVETEQEYYDAEKKYTVYPKYYIPASLKTVTITDCDYIQFGAFRNCSTLTSITIPDDLEYIDSGAFLGCSELTNLTIPDGVKSIGQGAFRYCRKLKSITIPNSVTSIGAGAFWDCNKLMSITIPDSIKIIDNGTFAGCSELTNITIPDGVTRIEGSAFWLCRKLNNITIPNSITSIGVKAFDGCDKLNTVYYNGTQNQRNQISITIDNDELTNAEWIYNCTAEKAEKCETLRNVYLKTAIQKKSGAKPSDDEYNLRLISMIDCLVDYSEVGFYITIAGYNDGENDEPIKYSTDTVYTSFLNGSTRVNASDYGAGYFSLVNITVPNEYYSANIKIKPYIVFADGTEFSGNEINTTVSKYIK